ncbi:MAG: hypothetical protein AABX99_01415 [Nanoarchaeota archaeon]
MKKEGKNIAVIILSIALAISILIIFFIATRSSQKDEELQILNSPIYSQVSFYTIASPNDLIGGTGYEVESEICERMTNQKYRCEGISEGKYPNLDMNKLKCTCYLHEVYVYNSIPSDL